MLNETFSVIFKQRGMDQKLRIIAVLVLKLFTYHFKKCSASHFCKSPKMSHLNFQAKSKAFFSSFS